jgi:hypothetical protein
MKRFMLTQARLPAHAHTESDYPLQRTKKDNAKVYIYSNANLTETVTIRPSEQCKYCRTFKED